MTHVRITGCLTSLLVAAAAQAGTITVTTAADAVDIAWATATIDDLPGPDGKVSLSEALIAANNTPGHDTIGFAIPQNEWILQFIHPGCAVLTALTGYYFHAYEEVTIDGTTQTAFTGDTNPNGWEVVIYGKELGLNAPNCTLVGFHSTSLGVSGANCLVQGNTGSGNFSLYQAHGTVLQGNSAGTIKLDRCNDVVVIGNTVQRVRVIGFGGSQPAMNNRIGGPEPGDRNFITGYGFWNSEGLPGGAAIQLVWTQGTVVENNRIGTTPDGMAQGNLACTMGVNLESENHDVTIRDNQIAGILGHGMGPHHAGQFFGWAIYFWGSTTGINIVNNTIGLDADGEPLLGSVWGINVDNFSGYTVNGVQIVDNVIAGHSFNGIRVGPTAKMRISGTEIYANGGLGIDLIGPSFTSGVTPNDPLDADTGGNGLQNFPVIDAAARQGGSVHVTGSLHSSPLGAFTLEFFASPACDPSGMGQGQMFLGQAAVSTDGSGNAAFDALLAASVPDGWMITSTATLEPLGLTSEFSACVALTSGAMPGDLNGDGLVDGADLGMLVGSWGPCSGCPADLDGDGTVGGADLSLLLGIWS